MFLKKLVKAFQANEIPYVLVGGHAVVIHGVVRGTIDIDLLTSIELANFKKLESVLNSLGLQSRLPVRAEDIFQFREEYIKNKNLVAWSFVNPKQPLEVVDVLITADAKDVSSEIVTFKDFKATVIDKKSLIQMKRESGRPQDLEDINALEKL